MEHSETRRIHGALVTTITTATTTAATTYTYTSSDTSVTTTTTTATATATYISSRTSTTNVHPLTHSQWHPSPPLIPPQVQLRSVPLVGVPGMDFVYGVVKMYYASSTEPGYLFPIQGVFVANTGE